MPEITRQLTFLLLVLWLSMLSVSAQSNDDANTRSEGICSRISEIKTLPRSDEPGVDAVYDEFVSAGGSAFPCLIAKITDTTIMKDPRCPEISAETRIGDVAYFILVMISESRFDEFLPEDVQKSYKTDGAYAYHEYIEKDGKRLELQSRLREWYHREYNTEAK